MSEVERVKVRGTIAPTSVDHRSRKGGGSYQMPPGSNGGVTRSCSTAWSSRGPPVHVDTGVNASMRDCI